MNFEILVSTLTSLFEYLFPGCSTRLNVSASKVLEDQYSKFLITNLNQFLCEISHPSKQMRMYCFNTDKRTSCCKVALSSKAAVQYLQTFSTLLLS